MFRLYASAILVMAITLSGLLVVAKVNAGAKGPQVPRAAGEQCVADTDLMRREHMVLMTHQRDETVVEGVRGNPYSIAGCVDCHAQQDASGKAIRVDAEGQFCQSCHTYAAVKIDCFGCHAAVPTALQTSGQASSQSSSQSSSQTGHTNSASRRVPWQDFYTSLKSHGAELKQ